MALNFGTSSTDPRFDDRRVASHRNKLLHDFHTSVDGDAEGVLVVQNGRGMAVVNLELVHAALGLDNGMSRERGDSGGQVVHKGPNLVTRQRAVDHAPLFERPGVNVVATLTSRADQSDVRWLEPR